MKDRNTSIDVFDFLVEGDGYKESVSSVDTVTEETSNGTIKESSGHEYEEPEEPDERDECEEIEDLDENNDCYMFEGSPVRVQTPAEDNEQKEESSDEYQVGEDDASSDEEPHTPSIIVQSADLAPEVFYRSMSDSGISMGSNSIEASLSSLPPKRSVVREEFLSRSAPRPSSRNELAVIDPRWTWNTSPGPFHDGCIPPPAPMPPPITYDMPLFPPYPPYTPYGTPPPMPEDEVRGPAIKIREPSQQEVRPKCFRAFTKVSTRVILHLQDDIAELEGELSVLDGKLDAIEADYGSDEEAPAHPGTTKHMLKARESEIYDELQFKLPQYSSALEGMQKIEGMSQPAVKSDLTKHHRWLESRISPLFRARHLVGNDLRTFSKAKSQETETVATPGKDTQFLVYSVLINTLLPFMAFKLVTNILTRLILLIIIAVIGATVQDRTKTKIRAEDAKCILMCISISFFAAVFL